MIVAGIFTFLIAPIFIKLLRFFPPVVTGTLVTIIGLCLVPVGALDAVTNPHTHEPDPTNISWFLCALGTIAIIVGIGNVLRADGVATVIGGVLNSFPYTAFSENVGLVRLTGVKSRWVVAAAGVVMIILGFLPKVAAVVASIPNPVLGGAALTLFATVAVVGIHTLGKVDFTDHRNLIIVTTSLALALWVTSYPDIAKAMPTGLNLSSAVVSASVQWPRSC